MISHVEFVRFRGFERLRANLLPHAYIVGPNSAGKSTLIEAIALAEQCLKIARRKLPTISVRYQGSSWKAYPLPGGIDNQDDPVRYDFGQQETSVTVQWKSNARIHINWPEEKDGEERGYFFLESEDGEQPKNLLVTRNLYSPLTIVPVVTPLERSEDLKDPDYVEKHGNSRLASRHFRNHAWIMSQIGEWSLYKNFCRTWLPEIEFLDVNLDSGVNRLAVFYREQGSRVPKELAWAGDGIQIWVQLLWHLWRAKGSNTILLDEPEVYLHPDLQRRLVRLLDSLSAQIILASHSADVIAEAPPEGVLWVDRRSGGARRANSQKTLSALSDSLGSSFNLALARSMRAKLVIASECQDLRVLRSLSKHVGANHLANEHEVSLIQLRQVANWSDIDQLGAIIREILPPKLPAVILLETGLRSEIANQAISKTLTAPGIKVIVWSRTEIENYLLDADTISRVSGASPEALSYQIAESHNQLRDITRAKFISEQIASAQEGCGHKTLTEAEKIFDSLWAKHDHRIELVRGSQVIKEINRWLETGGYRPISANLLAKAIRPQNIAPEVLNALLEIDEEVSNMVTGQIDIQNNFNS